MPLLELLEQDAPVTLDDRLGQAGGARGIEHPQGVLEADLLEPEGPAVRVRAELVP